MNMIGKISVILVFVLPVLIYYYTILHIPPCCTIAQQHHNNTVHKPAEKMFSPPPTNLTVRDDVRASLNRSKKLRGDIQERCQKHGISTFWDYETAFVKPHRLLLKPDYNFIYSENPKTGCTSFKQFMFLMDGDYNISGDVHGQPKGHFIELDKNAIYKPAGSRGAFDKLLKIGLIRNPLTKLVSAFRDKQQEFHKYLKPGVDYPEGASEFEIFEKFIDEVIIKRHRRYHYMNDKHLHPQWDYMAVCSYPYDMLIQYETAAEDLQVFQILTGTEDLEYPGSRVDAGTDSLSSMEVANQFYSKLDKVRMDAIYSAYDMDFKILGYFKFGEPGYPYVM